MALLAFVLLGALLVPVLLIIFASVYDHFQYKFEIKRLQNLPQPPNTRKTVQKLSQIIKNDKLKAVSDWSAEYDRLVWDTMPKHKKEKLQMDLAVEMTKGLPLKFATKEEPWNPTVSQMNSLNALETTTMRSITGEILIEHHTVVPITGAAIKLSQTKPESDIDRYVQEKIEWYMMAR